MQQTTRSSIRALRALKGIAQADLAAACGISQSSMSNIEAERSTPSAETIATLAKVLGCDSAVLTSPASITVSVTVDGAPNDSDPAVPPGRVNRQAVQGRHDEA